MFEKTKNFIANKNWNDYRDIRFLGLLAFLVMAFLTTWSGIKIVGTNYRLQQEIAGLQRQNAIKQLENDNLKLKNQYYSTDTYIELTARKQFNKGQPGEKMVVVTEEAAAAHAPKLTQQQADSAEAEQHLNTYQKNWQAWMNFFFHREE